MNTMQLAFEKAYALDNSQMGKTVRAKNRLLEQNRQFQSAVNIETRKRMTQSFYGGMNYREVRALVLHEVQKGETVL